MNVNIEFRDRYPGDTVLYSLEVDDEPIIDAPVVVWDMRRGMKKVAELVAIYEENLYDGPSYSFDGKDG